MLMSDGPTNFKNETLIRLANGLRVSHHFTVPYSPWSNSGIERLGKGMLRVFRLVTSEYQIHLTERIYILLLVQHALNSAPSSQRKNIAPVTAFTALTPSRPISTFHRSSSTTVVKVDEAHGERIITTEQLRKNMEESHLIVHEVL